MRRFLLRRWLTYDQCQFDSEVYECTKVLVKPHWLLGGMITAAGELCPPLRWGIVEKGIARGAYPVLRNFRFLSRTRLKTIISLTPEPPSNDLVDFANLAGISIIHINVRLTPIQKLVTA